MMAEVARGAVAGPGCVRRDRRPSAAPRRRTGRKAARVEFARGATARANARRITRIARIREWTAVLK